MRQGRATISTVGIVGWILAGAAAAAGTADKAPAGRARLAGAEVALDRLMLSPGLVDGVIDSKTRKALAVFQRLKGLPVTGALDEATWEALKPDAAAALTEYAIQSSDQKEVGECPADWIERSRLRRLPYPSVAEVVSERFHTSCAGLAALNPGVDINRLRPGSVLVVPNVLERRAPAVRAERLEIDLEAKTVAAIGAGERLIALFHCSTARDPSKRPVGSFKVTSVVRDPWYTFDPADWPEVKGVDRKLSIPPGPRGPVGVAWIGLSKPGYGIHGTPKPEDIGHTGSHGCFRLANWDALTLADMVRPGVPVVISPRSPMAGPTSASRAP